MSNKKQGNSRWKYFSKNPEKVSEQAQDSWSNEEFTLMSHTATFSSADIILNQELFQGVRDKDILEIRPVDPGYESFIVQVSSDSLITKTNTKISISSQLASVLSLTSRSLQVKVVRFNSNEYECDELVMSIKDQHICRSFIWTCSNEYQGLAVYKGQLIAKSSFRASVCYIVSNNKHKSTGLITSNTKITFRSKSCRMTILIEMSREMWEVSPSGILYWEKMMTFLTTCFERQLIRRVSHKIDVVFYTRLVSNSKITDVYRHVLRITDLRNSWMDAVKAIKREINFFPALIAWDADLPVSAERFQAFFPLASYCSSERLASSFHASMTYYTLGQDPGLPPSGPASVAVSSDCCYLEAVNYTLTRLQSEDMKNCTGNSIMVITAGTGLYNVNHDLAKLTKTRVLCSGTSVNVMSMKRHPLHKYPLFIYSKPVSHHNSHNEPGHRNSFSLTNFKSKSRPGWFSIHYFFSFMQLEATCNLQSAIHLQVHERHKKFMPQFRLASIPGDGLPRVKSTLAKQVIYDKNDLSKTVNAMKFQMIIHDAAVFAVTEQKAEELVNNSPRVRKWSIQKPQERSMTRKDSTESYRRESSIFARDHEKKDSILSSTHYVTPRKRFSAFKRRWAEGFKVKKEEEEVLKDENLINSKAVLDYYESVWSSILEPCLLPLYNDFWPKAEDLGTTQFNKCYPWEMTREQAIINIIGAKLDDGFQIVRKVALDRFGAKITSPDLALSLGYTYHEIKPDHNDEINLDYMIYYKKNPVIQHSTYLTVFNTESKKFEELFNTFSFQFPTSWTQKDWNLLGQTSNY